MTCRFAMAHKYRNNKDSYEMDELFRMKHQKLLTVGKLRRCRKKGVNSICGIGNVDGCTDYIQHVGGSKSTYSDGEALKHRKMPSLRVFCKRRIGTPPTIMKSKTTRRRHDSHDVQIGEKTVGMRGGRSKAGFHSIALSGLVPNIRRVGASWRGGPHSYREVCSPWYRNIGL